MACFFRTKLKTKNTRTTDAKVMRSNSSTRTPCSLLEIKVALPSEVIYGDNHKTVGNKKCEYDPQELTELPKTRLGEGTLGSLFKVVLDCGLIITIRKVKKELVIGKDEEFKALVNFFGEINDPLLLPIVFSYWYGGEAFVIYEYFFLGSLEELLHGSEGIQFTQLSWRIRTHIALCAAKAVASLHTRVFKNGEGLVCGVIKSSNILIRADCSACLSGCETPYLVSPALLIRRNPGRIAPELINARNSEKKFTRKSDVYSFGILLLELITGKRPAVTDLGEYILQKRKKEGWKGVYDIRFGEVKENDMITMIGIARYCLLRNPKDRPSMDKVVDMIQGLLE